MRQNSPTLCFCIGLSCLFVSGCINETQSGDVTTLTCAGWVTVATFVASVGGIILGWLLRKHEKLQGWTILLIGAGLLSLFFFLPATLLDKVVVDPRHFTTRTGFWFYPKTHDIKFLDISRIEILSETTYSRRSSHTRITLKCIKKRGRAEDVVVGDMMKHCLDKILGMAISQGVEVVDKRGN